MKLLLFIFQTSLWKGATLYKFSLLIFLFFFSKVDAQECVIIIQGFENSDDYFASNGADALEEAMKNFPGGAQVTKLRPSASNKSSKPGTNYSSKTDLLEKLKTALCDEKCKDVMLAFIGHGEGGPDGLYSPPSSSGDGGMWVGESGQGNAKRSTFIEARDIAALIDECKKEIKLFDNHCYATAMYNGINNALKNKDLLKEAIASSKWNEESKFDWPLGQKNMAFYEFLKEYLIDYYKIIGDPNVMEEIRKKAEELKKKAEEENKKKEAEREQLRKEIAVKEKELNDCNTAKDKLEKEIKDLEAEVTKAQQKITDLSKMIELMEEDQKLEKEEKEWSSTKENEKIKEVKKKYEEEWRNLPINQQTPDKRSEIKKKGDAEIAEITKQFKAKREQYKTERDENAKKRKAQAKKLKDQGVSVDPSSSESNKTKVQNELTAQENAKKELEKKINTKKTELKEKKDKIGSLQDAIKELRNKLAAILDHSTVPPVMELVLHNAFISAKANTTTSTAEEPQKAVADNEKITLPDKKIKTIGIDEYSGGNVKKYRRYINFYKIKDEKTGNCVVVGYESGSLNGGWPERPLISKNCKEDCSVLEVGIKEGAKEIIIKLVKQSNGTYKADVDGKEEENQEFAFYIPFTPPENRPEKLAVIGHTFTGNDQLVSFSINGKSLNGDFDDLLDKGNFSFKENQYNITFLEHGAAQLTSSGLSWTQQNSRHYSLYDADDNRIGEAGFIVDGEKAKGSLWLEAGDKTIPISGFFDPYTGQFELQSQGLSPPIILEKNDTDGLERSTWHNAGQDESYDMLPNTLPMPYIEITSDQDSTTKDNQTAHNTHPQIKWNTISDGLPENVLDGYLGTRISKTNHASGEITFHDFGKEVNSWEDHDVRSDTWYTYAISSITSNNSICESGCTSNPPYYSYPQYFEWGENIKDSIPPPWDAITLTGERMKPGYPFFIPVSHSFPWIPVIAGVIGVGVVTYLFTNDNEGPEDCSFTANTQPTSSTCHLSNGGIMVNVNPPGEYSYSWSNGSNTSSLQNILPGNYSLTITRTGTSCTQILQATVTNVNPTINTNISTMDASCGQSNGAAVSSVDPPGAYTYLWSNGSTNSLLEHVASGTYTLTVTGAGTCQSVSTTTIGELPPDLSITITSTPANCGMNDGSATVNVDPPGEYTYLWSNGQTSSQLTGVNAGNYSLTVSLAGTHCSSSSSATIDELPPSFVITTTTTPSACGMNDGTATVSADPPGEYTYLWSNGQTVEQAVNLGLGTYTVTVSITGTNCSQNSTVTVDELPPSFILSTTMTPANCGLSDGTGTVNVDPPGTYNYLWSSGQVTSQVISLSVGTYSVTVTIPGTSCSKSIEIDIDELPAAFTVTAASTPSGCGQPTGTASAMADPPAEYNYQWSNGLVGEQVSNLAPGQYIVSVSVTGSSCVVTDTIVVEQIMPSFTGTITTMPADCGLANGSGMIIIDPMGTYTYAWSNQQTGTELQNVMTGQYQVVVTDINFCTASFSADIAQNPAEYIEVTGTTPATCIGGGEIVFTLSTPGSGMLQVDIISPEGTSSQLLPTGSFLLSSFINIVPGTYSLNIFDQSIGPVCSENIAITIDDQTPALMVMDDSYLTTGENPVNGSMLNNDSGLNLEVSSVSNAIGGTVVFNSNGQFTYTPNPGFSGEGSFMYEVTDACGNTGTGIVIITVEMVTCNFTISTTLIPAHCGLSDGYINVEVNEPGSYSYTWDTGDTGPELIDVSAAVYNVTIEDVTLGCFLEFEIELNEYPVEYIENVVITQPTCSTPGDIQFDVTAPGAQDVLTMEVTHPNGTEVFQIDPGSILLRDYVAITPGTYTIDVYIGNVGSECFDEFTVTLIMPPSLEIEAEAVFPPSAPSAMDGSATIVAIVPGSLPYIVYVDGLPVSTANSNTFTVGGMGIGMHTIQIEDANGCFSNLLTVIIPFPDIIFSMGTALLSFPSHTDLPETANLPSGEIVCNGLLADVKYQMGPTPQHALILLVPFRIYGPPYTGYWIELQYRSQLGSIDKKKYRLILEGGIGMESWSSSFKNPVSPFLELNGTGSFSLGDKILLETELGFKGWSHLHEPFWKIIVSFPFIH